jgi:hypothetical protein
MSTYSQIAWLPLCAGVSGLGFVGSYLAYRRRGFASGLRGVAWSLLPIAAYLTQSVQTVWDMGVKLVDFATGFVFSPERWAGIAVVGLAFVAFVVSGLMLRRQRPAKDEAAGGSRWRFGRQSKPKGDSKPNGDSRPKQALERRANKPAAGDDDDFGEIEQILRNRGIS